MRRSGIAPGGASVQSRWRTIAPYDSDASRPTSLRPQPSVTAGLGEVANAQDVALALGDGDDASGIQQIEDVARLDALVVGRQRQLVALVVGVGRRLAGGQQRLAFLLGVAE